MQESDIVINKLAEHYKAIIELIGENPNREGLKKTPIRAAKALYFATQGYRQNATEVMKQAMFEYAGSRMIIVRDIEFYSFCEHHILPFFGKVSVGYIPDGKMIWLSKLARVVNVFARRLQVQERLTAEIMHEISHTLGTKGVMVVCKADHLCMKMLGVEKQESSSMTMDYDGLFASDSSLRQEFLKLIE